MIAGAPDRFDELDATEVLGIRVPVAATTRSRLLGLAFLARHRAPRGLFLPRCHSVHTFGMRFPIDVVFFDADGREIRRVDGLRPRRLVSQRGSAAVLELPSP